VKVLLVIWAADRLLSFWLKWPTACGHGLRARIHTARKEKPDRHGLWGRVRE
jgi:hypothetical protein